MSVLQSKLDEIRYMKRQNLEEEAKMVGNYYRDIIRQFGIDANYYKAKLPYLDVFKTTLDENTLILHAYGQQIPDYSVSTDMITFCEVDQDVFTLNKYGVVPNMDVNFYFDTRDFACALAYKLGQLKEYKVKFKELVIDVPIDDGEVDFPFYKIGYETPLFYETEILSGKYTATVKIDELNKEQTVMCHPYEHGDINLSFKVNDTIYKSMDYKYSTKDFIDQVLFLTYKIVKITTEKKDRFMLCGYLHGAVLFHDITKVGKYLDMIHPEIGDIVTIDFPDNNNRQQFEITDCYDKQLGNDGINPLLHKYVWKCKARRYIDSGEGLEEHHEANERWQESMDILNNADEKVVEQIAKYDEENNDAVYGGYEREEKVYDRNKVDNKKAKLEFIDDGSYIELHVFGDGSQLITDGYELYYVDTNNMMTKMTEVEDKIQIDENLVASGIQYIKATDNALFFVNFDNKVQRICDDEEFTDGEIEYCLNSLLDTTYETKTDMNKNGDFYYKFKDSQTVLMSLNDHLYCRFGNKKGKMAKIC